MSNWIRHTSILDSLMILSNLALPYLVPLVFSNPITFTDNFLNIQVHLGEHVSLSVMDQSSVAAFVSKKMFICPVLIRVFWSTVIVYKWVPISAYPIRSFLSCKLAMCLSFKVHFGAVQYPRELIYFFWQETFRTCVRKLRKAFVKWCHTYGWQRNWSNFVEADQLHLHQLGAIRLKLVLVISTSIKLPQIRPRSTVKVTGGAMLQFNNLVCNGCSSISEWRPTSRSDESTSLDLALVRWWIIWLL